MREGTNTAQANTVKFLKQRCC